MPDIIKQKKQEEQTQQEQPKRQYNQEQQKRLDEAKSYSQQKQAERMNNTVRQSQNIYNATSRNANTVINNQPTDTYNPADYLQYLRSIPSASISNDNIDSLRYIGNRQAFALGASATDARNYVNAATDASRKNADLVRNAGTAYERGQLGSGETRDIDEKTKLDIGIQQTRLKLRDAQKRRREAKKNAEQGDYQAQLDYEAADRDVQRYLYTLNQARDNRKAMDITPSAISLALDRLNQFSVNPTYNANLKNDVDTVQKEIDKLKDARNNDPEYQKLKEKFEQWMRFQENGVDVHISAGMALKNLQDYEQEHYGQISYYQNILDGYNWYQDIENKLASRLTKEELNYVLNGFSGASADVEFSKKFKDFYSSSEDNKENKSKGITDVLGKLTGELLDNNKLAVLKKHFSSSEIVDIEQYLQRLATSSLQKSTENSIDAMMRSDDPLNKYAFAPLMQAASVTGSVGGGWLSTMELPVQVASKVLTNAPLNYNMAGSQLSSASEAVTAKTVEQIQNSKAIPDSAKKPIEQLYSTGISMAQSFLAISMLGESGGKLLGASAGASALRDAKLRGLTDEAALTTGIVAAIAEMAGEKYSIERLLSIKSAKTFEQFLANTVAQAFTEASEEAVTTALNTISDYYINHGQSELNQAVRKYQEQGMSKKEAQEAAWLDWSNGLLDDVVGGFLSGAIMGGGAGIIQNVQTTNVGKTIFSQNTQKQVGKFAGELGALANDQNIQKLAFALEHGGLSEFEAGQLYNDAVESAMEIMNANDVARPTKKKVLETLDHMREAVAEAYESTPKAKQRREAIENSPEEERRKAREDLQQKIQEMKVEKAQQETSNRRQASNAAMLRGERDNVSAVGTTVSADGQTTSDHVVTGVEDTDEGLKVVVTDVASDGKPLAGSEGRTIPANSIRFADGSRQQLHDNAVARGMQANEYTGYVNGYDSETFGDVDTYNDAFSAIVQYAGEAGINNLMEMRRFLERNGTVMENSLSNGAIRAAIDLGLRLYPQVKQRNAATLGKGVDVSHVSNAKMAELKNNKDFQASVRLAKILNELFGINVEFHESLADENGVYQGVNGEFRYNKDTGESTIQLDVNAGLKTTADKQTAILRTFGHELTHFIAAKSPAQFSKLKSYVQQKLGDEVWEDLVAAQMKNGNIREVAEEEVVAQGCVDVLRDSRLVAIMRVRDNPLFRTIQKFVLNTIKSIDKVMNSLGITVGEKGYTLEAALLNRFRSEIAELWDDGLEAAFGQDPLLNENPNIEDMSENTEAFEESEEAIRNQVRPPFTDGTKQCNKFVASLSEEARKTYDLCYNVYQASRVSWMKWIPEHTEKATKKIVPAHYAKTDSNITSVFMRADEWNSYVKPDGEHYQPKFAEAARRIADIIPEDIRKNMNMNADGTLNETDFEKEFKMSRSVAQRLVDAFPLDTVSTNYTVTGADENGNPVTKSVTMNEKLSRVNAIGGEAYRQAVHAATLQAFLDGKLRPVGIDSLTNDNWGSMGFLATNTKTVASGDFTTLCPQLFYNRGCKYCYRTAALRTGINNKLVGASVWYSGEILRMKDADITKLNAVGGLRIQSFGDWMPQFSTQLADMIADAELRGLQVKIITKETSMIDYVARLREQGLGKNVYFNLSCDYIMEEAGKADNLGENKMFAPLNPERPFERRNGRAYWKRAMSVEEGYAYAQMYDWVNVRIVALNQAQFLRGLADPRVSVVTGYHGDIRSLTETIDTETGEQMVEVEPLGDNGMPRFVWRNGEYEIAYPGKNKKQKALASAILANNLVSEYYKKSCCITGRCASCAGICGKMADSFAIKNATNRDAESVEYWRNEMERVDTAKREGTEGRIRYQTRSRNYDNYTREQLDAAYDEAVARGAPDEELEPMVLAAARKAGFKTGLYHGTQTFGYTRLSRDKVKSGKGFFLTDDPSVASSYSGDYDVRRISGERELQKNISSISLEKLLDYYTDAHGMPRQSYRIVDRQEIAQMAEDKLKSVRSIGKVAYELLTDAKRRDVLMSLVPEKSVKAVDQYLSAIAELKNASDLEGLNSAMRKIDSSSNAFGRDYSSFAMVSYWFKSAPVYEARTYLSSAQNADKEMVLHDDHLISRASIEEDILGLFGDENQGNYSLGAWLGKTLHVDADEQNGAGISFLPKSIASLRRAFWNDPTNERAKNAYIKAYNEFADKYITPNNGIGTNVITSWAFDNGYDSVEFENIADNGEYTNNPYTQSNVYAVFDPKHIKSLDPKTYDNNGNVIPLSKRFDMTNENTEVREDMRYQLRNRLSLPTTERVREVLANSVEWDSLNSETKHLVATYANGLAEVSGIAAELADIRKALRTDKVIQKARRIAEGDSSVTLTSDEMRQLYARADALDSMNTKALRYMLNLQKLSSTVLKHVVNDSVQKGIVNALVEERRAAKMDIEAALAHAKRKSDFEYALMRENRDYWRERAGEIREKQGRANAIKDIRDMRNRLYDRLNSNDRNNNVIYPAQRSLANALMSLMDSMTAERDKSGKTYMARMATLQRLLDNIEYAETNLRQYPLGGLQELAHSMQVDLQTLADSLAGRSFNELGVEELRAIRRMLRGVIHNMNEANKLLTNNENISTLANETKSFLEKIKSIKDPKSKGFIRQFRDWTLVKGQNPIYFYDRFGKAGKALFKGFMRANSDMYLKLRDIENFTTNEVAEWNADNIRKWEKDTVTIDGVGVNNRKLTLTQAELLTLYMYWKQEDSRAAMLRDGIVMKDAHGVEGNDEETIDLNEEDMERILANLDPEVRAVADQMTEYIKKVADWGNAVSMKRSAVMAYIIRNYFPMVREYVETDENGKQTRMVFDPTVSFPNNMAVLNYGFNFNRVMDSTAPLQIGNGFDLFISHASNMARFSAFTPIINDLNAWYNAPGVKNAIQNTYGVAATEYVEKFMEDVGMSDDRNTAFFFDKLIANARVGNIIANLSTAMVQATTYFRAMGEIDPKYMLTNPLIHVAMRNANEAETYSGVAVQKSMGFYTPGVAIPMQQRLKYGEYDWKGHFGSALKQAGLWGMEQADRYAWGLLWQACKKEVLASGQKFNSEAELMQAVADRFEEVVYRTQVVDSRLTRSDIMRSKDRLVSMASLYMAESTITFNNLMAIANDIRYAKAEGDTEALNKAKVKAVRRLGGFLTTTAAIALARALIAGIRRKKKYETYGEALERLWKSVLLGELNPLSMIPWLTNIADLLEGYDVERMDVVGAANLIKMAKLGWQWIQVKAGKLDKKKAELDGLTNYGMLLLGLETFGDLTGYNLRNVVNDIISLTNLFGWTSIDRYESAKKQAAEAAYKALESGDADRASWIYDEAKKGGAKEKELKQGLTNYLNGLFADGTLSREAFEERLVKFADFLLMTSEAKAVGEWDVRDKNKSQLEQDYLDGKITKEEAIAKLYADKRAKENIRTAFMNDDIDRDEAYARLIKEAGFDPEAEGEKNPNLVIDRWQYSLDNADMEVDGFNTYSALLDSVASGDKKAVEDEKKRLMETYNIKEDTIDNKVESYIQDSMLTGDITDNVAMQMLTDLTGDKHADKTVHKWYENDAKNLLEADVISRADAESMLKNKAGIKDPTALVDKWMQAEIQADYKAGDITESEAVSRLMKDAGYVSKESTDGVVHSWNADIIKQQYDDGDISRNEAKQQLISKAGAKEDGGSADPDYILDKLEYNAGKETEDPNFSMYLGVYDAVNSGKSLAEINKEGARIQNDYGIKKKEVDSKIKSAILNSETLSESKKAALLVEGEYFTGEETGKKSIKWAIDKAMYQPDDDDETFLQSVREPIEQAIGKYDANAVLRAIADIEKTYGELDDRQGMVKEELDEYVEEHMNGSTFTGDARSIAALIDSLGLWKRKSGSQVLAGIIDKFDGED